MLLDCKDESTQERYRYRLKHAIAFFDFPIEISEFTIQNDLLITIVKFKNRNGWIYLTNGLSELDQPNSFADTRIELMCYTKKDNNNVKELLLKVAEYPFQTQEDLWVWDTIPAPLEELGMPSQYQGIILTPPPFGPDEFEFFKIDDQLCRILAIQGITETEMNYAINNGGQKIGERVMHFKAPWLDKQRRPIIF
ncbi:MAG: suppressor of fused domain protein [Firmicutes bacterium]|nr:suppressor of fused domain protein [Bacillota bacterium]